MASTTLPQEPGPDTVDFYLQTARADSIRTPHPVTLFTLPSLTSSSPDTATPPQPEPVKLNPNGLNNLLLFPGSFNPPHAGHLATIEYFYKHREDFDIKALFIFADPSTTVSGRVKKHNTIILPQEFRYKLFATHPTITYLLSTGFLKILLGDMAGHIAILRSTTDLIAAQNFNVKLTGFLGGDKLSRNSKPHEKPGELIEWGPVDEFLIMNARRPVDFYHPWQEDVNLDSFSDEDVDIDFPPANQLDNLPGCTSWHRGPIDFVSIEQESRVGQLWSCKALTVPGEPMIRFRASERSASNGISSTKIRKTMCEAGDGELLGELKEMVLSAELLVEWLVRERERGREGEGHGEGDGEKAFL